ncbi:transposase [Microbacterium sp. 1P10AE]|uniref:transposase n=1 Tax=Microbacterium sp. 1P10AE TaxID=3132286 RepID=UPI0039A0604A
MPRPYPSVFRERALKLLRAGRTVADAAVTLGIAQSCLYRWKQQDLIDRGMKPAIGHAPSAELAAANRRIRELEEENKILRKAVAAVEQVVLPKDRFRLVDELHPDGVRIRKACCALGVSTSEYYDWRSRAPATRSIRHAWLTNLIGQIHEASCGTYGRMRVRAELQCSHEITIGHNTVGLLMRQSGLGDRHYATAELATNALRMAIDSRQPGPGTIIHGITARKADSIGRRNTLTAEVSGGDERLGCEDRRCARGGSSAVARGSGSQAADAFARTACALEGGAATVLAADRDGHHVRGSCDRGGRVRAGRDALVSPRWRHDAAESDRTVGPIPVLRRTRGDRTHAREGQGRARDRA